ncbi:glutaminyl-peptide cyclotransferase [Mucilaginibacter terrenus]|nr:glutaminyl-peptide cyclotransferase [Mucilaginibacter terrenus]
MNKRLLYLLAIALFAAGCNGCKSNKSEEGQDITITPEAGTTYKAGDAVNISVKYPAEVKPDSVVYLMDDKRIGSVKDSSAVQLKTDTLVLGARVITAKVYQSGKSQDVTTNIVLLAAKAPEELAFTVEKVFPHDTSSYTEGLLYQDGVLYESDGGRVAEGSGQSSLRKVDLATGKVLKKVDIDPTIFAEGIAIVGDKIIQLTYTERKGFVYNKNTFALENTFTNNVGIEGWGLCFDGQKLYMDDKTNRIFFLDKDDYHQTGFIDVYDDKGPINQVNELEYIDGKLYANVYETDEIIVIDPKTGAVLQRAGMVSLYPNRNPGADYFNGIAYDKATGRIFVTGKKWDKLFQVKFTKR